MSPFEKLILFVEELIHLSTYTIPPLFVEGVYVILVDDLVAAIPILLLFTQSSASSLNKNLENEFRPPWLGLSSDTMHARVVLEEELNEKFFTEKSRIERNFREKCFRHQKFYFIKSVFHYLHNACTAKNEKTLNCY